MPKKKEGSVKISWAMWTIICLGVVFLGAGCIQHDPSRELIQPQGRQQGKVISKVKEKKRMAAIPLTSGGPQSPENIAKKPEPTEKMAVIPNREDRPASKSSRKKQPEPEKMMAIIPGSSED